ncbi:MAG: ABC transporter ATP-binding protein/permease [Clostridia bacterium]|nr:ABC transporter ATP-binding protein/permease [Clostridia bacterium]
MKRILKLLRPFRQTLIISIIFSVASTVLQILLPIYTRKILSEGVIARDMSEIIKTGVIMLGMTLVGVVASLGNTYFSTKTSVGYAMHIRDIVFTKVSHLSQSDVDKIGVSSLMTRTTNDVKQVHDIILSSLKSLLPVPIMIGGGFYMAYITNPRLLKTILYIIPILLLIVIMALIVIVPLYSKMQKLLDRLNFLLRSKISGIRVIRAFNKSEYEDSRFEETNGKLRHMTVRATRIMSSLLPIVTVALYSIIVYIIYICIRDVQTPGLKREEILGVIPNMYMFLSYFTIIIGGIASIVQIVITFPRAQVSAKRLNEIFDTVPDIKEPENPVIPDENERGSLEFRNVTFKYKPRPKPQKRRLPMLKMKGAPKKPEQEEETVLPDEEKSPIDRDTVHDISFSSRKGEITAVIGLTGCGKSTLVSLIPRLYDVTEGQILIDGVDVRDMPLSELHKRIAYVPQKSYLFSDTVRGNVLFGNPDATDSEVWHALEVAQAKGFVSELPEELDAFVSQSGKNFSGGQRQRLAIARSVIKNAEIYILDDSFSALDLGTDARLRASLRAELPDANIIIVAQRVGTVINADRIIVMDNGEAVGMGTHEELLESCEVYKQIVASQLPGEEDAA